MYLSLYLDYETEVFAPPYTLVYMVIRRESKNYFQP